MSITFKVLRKKKHNDLDSIFISKRTGVVTSLGLSFFICFVIISFLYLKEFNLKVILPNRYYIFFVSLFVLSFLSFIDDVKEIDAKIKLIIQLILVYFSTTNLHLSNIDIPLKLLIFLVIIIWVYITNIINFIDGSDGNCLNHSIHFFLGYILIAQYFELYNFSYYLSYVNTALLIPFLFFNFPKAKAFMGDTGSIYLGYIIGYIFLSLVLFGKPLLAISLLMYPLMDCTITIFIKISKGYYPWAKLADYFFLKPILNRRNHKLVFYSGFIHNFLSLLFIFLQLKISNLFVVLNILNSLILLLYYNSFKIKK